LRGGFSETKVPIGEVTMKPSAFRFAIAFCTVVMARSYSWDRSLIEGSRAPGASFPDLIRSRKIAAS
jgi:hypothetical protein